MSTIANPDVVNEAAAFLLQQGKQDYVQELQKAFKELQLLRIMAAGLHLTSGTEQSQLAMQLWFRDYGSGTAVPKTEPEDGKD